MGYYTFSNLQTRISAEINEASNVNVTVAQVKTAIISAIEYYERQRKWFSETVNKNLWTLSGTEFVPLPNDFVFLDKAQIQISTSNIVPLVNVGWDEYSSYSFSSTTSGQPANFCVYGEKLWLYPTPNDVYTLILSYVSRLQTLSASDDHNGWTDYAEPLIRSRAKWDIFNNLLYFPKLAAVCKAEELDTFSALEMEQTQKSTTGRQRAYYL